jgi:hypothetical protein
MCADVKITLQPQAGFCMYLWRTSVPTKTKNAFLQTKRQLDIAGGLTLFLLA